MMREELVDKIVSGRIMRKVLFEVSNGKFDELEKVIKELDEVKDYDFSDSAISNVSFLMKFLVDCKLYDYLFDLVKACCWIVTMENHNIGNEECLLSYAIRMIKDDNIIIQLIGLCDKNQMAWGFYIFGEPSLIAAELGRYELIPVLIEKDLCLEGFGCGKYTVLQYAAEHSDYELAEKALGEWGHDPDLCNKFTDIPAISIAVQKNDFDMVSLLWTFGADINATDGNGNTVLAYCRSDEMFGYLVEKGAKVSDPDLMLLCSGINELKENGVISPQTLDEILLSGISDFKHKSDNLILLAVKYGDVKSFMKLCRFCNDPYRNTDLLSAVFSGYKLHDMSYKKTVKQLIELTDILIANDIKFRYEICLHESYFFVSQEAEIFNNTDEKLCSELFNNISLLGGDLSDEEFICFLLGSAVCEGNIPLIKFCLEKGAAYSDLNDEFESAASSLLDIRYNRYKKDHPEIVEAILRDMVDWDCDLNHAMVDSNTVLHKLAACEDSAGFIKMAIKYGADPTLRNAFGMTPYDIAVEHNMPNAVVESLRYMY